MRSIVTVTTPAAGTALTTLGAVIDELGVTDAAQHPAISLMIAQASAAITGYLGRTLARESVVETFRDVDCYPALPLARVPAASIASVVVDGTTLAASEYELSGDAMRLHRLSNDTTVDWIAAKIVVTYAGGYILPGAVGANLPAEIEWACVLTAVAAYHARGQDPALRSEAVDGIGARSWLDPTPAVHGALPWAAAERLQPYRRYAL